jgi:hypothetical protein
VAKTALTELTEVSMVSFKKNWWMWLAGLLGVLQLVGVAGFGLDSDSSTTEKIVGAIIMGGSAAMVFIGLRQIERNGRLGGLLVGIGVIPSAIAGVVVFWFPPMWLVSAAGIAVMVKAFQEVGSARRVRRGDPTETV